MSRFSVYLDRPADDAMVARLARHERLVTSAITIVDTAARRVEDAERALGFARAGSVDELLVKATHRTSTLDRFKPYVNQRWNEGCYDVVQLHTELQGRGWTGSVQTLRRYMRAFRSTTVKAPTTPAPPKPRRVVRWIMSNPDNVHDEDKAQLKMILTRCPELDAVAKHVRDFAAMMRDLRGDRLDDWMRRVQADDLPALHSFVTGVNAITTLSSTASP